MEENDKEDELPEQEVEATTGRKPLVYDEMWLYLLAAIAFIAVIIYLFYLR